MYTFSLKGGNALVKTFIENIWNYFMVSRDEYFKRVSSFHCSINEIGLFRGTSLSDSRRYTATATELHEYSLVDMEETREEEKERVKKELNRERQRRFKESLYNQPLRHDLVIKLGVMAITALRKCYYLGGFSTRHMSRAFDIDRELIKETVLNRVGF